jgi:RsmE family RNA methyltransferase
VNLILFESHEIGAPLSRGDRRASHIIKILRRGVGDEFDAGLVNGPQGKATVTAIDASTLSLAFRWDSAPAPTDSMTLVVGLPRPQTARDLLREMTTLGVSHLDFVAADKAEPSYASSTLWSSGEWKRHLVAGAEQAFTTCLPEVRWGHSLAAAIADLPSDGTRLALDNHEPAVGLGQSELPADRPVALAVGPERGWSERERGALREHRFVFVHLGPRILRVETAAIAAMSIIRAKRGSM